MLRLSNIMQLLRAEQFSHLVDRILANGRCRSRAVRRMLREAVVAEAAATGLALQRVLELTYGPTAEADELVHRLLRSQASDACGEADGTPMARARGVAASAWCCRIEDWRHPPSRIDSASQLVSEAIERASVDESGVAKIRVGFARKPDAGVTHGRSRSGKWGSRRVPAITSPRRNC